MNCSRRGASLAELLVVMTACTVVISLSSQLLCRVMRIQVESRGHAEVERNAMRLSKQFRQDVHLARSVEVKDSDGDDSEGDGSEGDGDAFLLLPLADGKQAEYSRHGNAIMRRLSHGSDTIAREEFDFPDAVDIAVREEDEPPRVNLTITVRRVETISGQDQRIAKVPKNPISVQMESILGRDIRFMTPPNSREAAE